MSVHRRGVCASSGVCQRKILSRHNISLRHLPQRRRGFTPVPTKGVCALIRIVRRAHYCSLRLTSPLESLYAERSSWTHVPRRAGDDERDRELCALSRRETSANLGTGWARLQFPDYHCEHRELRDPRDRRAEGTIVSFANDVSESEVPLVGSRGKALCAFRGGLGGVSLGIQRYPSEEWMVR